MTDRRSPDARRDRAARDGETPSTLRSIEAAEVTSPDNESAEQPVYYEPQPLVAVSDHKTLEIDTIKLAEDIDPRRLPTELRLRPPSIAPPDSGWPQPDIVVVSSQPPSADRRRWRASVALLLLLAALLTLVLARAAAQRWHGSAQPVGASGSTEAHVASAALAVPSAVPANSEPEQALGASAAAVTPAATEPDPSSAPPEVPEVAVPAVEKRPAHRAAKPNRHSNSNPTPNASSRALAAPSVGQPKRAIY